jgi:hypothetical protein
LDPFHDYVAKTSSRRYSKRVSCVMKTTFQVSK